MKGLKMFKWQNCCLICLFILSSFVLSVLATSAYGACPPEDKMPTVPGDYLALSENWLQITAVPFFTDDYGLPNQLVGLIVKAKNIMPGKTMDSGKFFLLYQYDDGGTRIFSSSACGSTGCGPSCTSTVDSGTLNENNEIVIQFYFPSDIHITTDNFSSVSWSLFFSGNITELGNVTLSQPFPSASQRAAGWGSILFNEEWEANIYGYPENIWGHGSCWLDANAQGLHLYDSSIHGLRNVLFRDNPYGSWDYPLACSTAATTNMAITANSWIQLWAYMIFTNPVRVGTKDNQIQYIELDFDNNLTLILYDSMVDLQYWPADHIPATPTAFFPIYSGYTELLNIYDMFNQNGITPPAGLTLQNIKIIQFMDPLTPHPANRQQMDFYLDYIRIFQTDPNFNICQ